MLLCQELILQLTLFFQIEGGFTQGYGLFTLEDHRWSPKGHLLTRGPGFYKIPGFGDVPTEFNVSLLTGVPNDRAICSSKVIIKRWNNL